MASSLTIFLSASLTLLAAMTLLQGCGNEVPKEEEVGAQLVVECYSSKTGGTPSYWNGRMKSNGEAVKLVSPRITAPPEGEASLAMNQNSECSEVMSAKLAMRKKAFCIDSGGKPVHNTGVEALVAITPDGQVQKPQDGNKEMVLLIESKVQSTQVSQAMLVTLISHETNACRPGEMGLGLLFPNTLVWHSTVRYAAYMDDPRYAGVATAFIYEPLKDFFGPFADEWLILMTAARRSGDEDATIQNWGPINVDPFVTDVPKTPGSALLQHHSTQPQLRSRHRGEVPDSLMTDVFVASDGRTS